jgi:pyrroloquinoline quinone biosynthesis protein B|tara:strand:+ start:196 stop:1134 length:939 start_codon:yes stop_codon:yes gene_type:complete
MLKVLVLGSGAGGGSPQWNCNADVSRSVRTGQPGTSRRTQSSIAVSVDESNWFLFNASPDLGSQIQNNRQLHPDPSYGLRHSPILGTVLTNGDVDHVAGLLTVRESYPLAIYATQRVQSVLEQNAIFNVLNPKFVDRRKLSLDQRIELRTKNKKSTGLFIEPFSVPGKVALWLEDEKAGKNFGTVEEDTIAVKISSTDKEEFFYYIPACANMTKELARKIKGSPLVFFDGTLWRDDEMVINKVGYKTGKRMGHMSNSGPGGTIAAFKNLDVKRKIFIHINTTNPILIDGSEERKFAEKAGWEVSYDGMEVIL